MELYCSLKKILFVIGYVRAKQKQSDSHFNNKTDHCVCMWVAWKLAIKADCVGFEYSDAGSKSVYYQRARVP